MKNLALVVEEEPSADLLAEMEIEPPDSLYGLYQGTPLPERDWDFGNTPSGPHHHLPAADRGRLRGRGRDARGDRRDADPRGRALLRPQRRGNRGHRGAVLARRHAGRTRTTTSEATGAQALRPALSRAGLGHQAGRRRRPAPGRDVSRDWTRPRRADRVARAARRAPRRGRDRSRPRRRAAGTRAGQRRES